ncbi:P-loop containing nucleoside triphosphate hydrolase protein [Microstroma glucosiphilum]|uniref:RNA helicase n=1 Tax=Pseudomicrostroma glucosiphilum TaxID=1684307 RepID=A0A316TYX5_9BASI|nr:P-loop containing nucleoside triphosphate hydrolase protein [Pseudomicrostroma glucosiphilum]PWN17894.1 P-loop containing nucleoside triphosphate hydrolase protein [Pseudomicrostroma glucosiphilum]
MPPPQRQRYNAKARQSSVGGSSHKRRKQHTQSSGEGGQEDASASSSATPFTHPDSNREVIVPGSAQEEAWKAKEKLRKELLAASSTEDPNQKLSAKKRKRLDAYIASRLKKEARNDLLAELAKSSAEVRGDRMDFASARTLGTGKLASAREIIEGKAKARDFGRDEKSASESDGEDHESERPQGSPVPSSINDRPQGEVLDDPIRRQRILEAASLFSQPSSSKAVSTDTAFEKTMPQVSAAPLGSALAKGPDGQPLIPISRKRRRKGPSQRERRRQRDEENLFADSSKGEEESNSSEDSSEDSSEESDDDSSTSSVSERLHEPSDPHSEHESLDTDSEDEAVFLEAMRRRGLPLPSEDEEDSDDAKVEGTTHISSAAQPDGATFGTSPSEDLIPVQAPLAESESPPWQGFASEEDASRVMSQESSDASSEGSTADDDEEGTESEDEEEDALSQETKNTLQRGREVNVPSRGSGFKVWARTALESIYLGNGVGEARTEEGVPLQPVAGLSVKVSDMGAEDGVIRGPLGENEPASRPSPFAEKHYAEIASSEAIRNVPVQRTSEIIEARLRLPVVQEEDRVVRTILENQVTVICGETGSGKTTQVAQMLFERGFGTPGSDNPGLVGITQPRRVAAMSTADRVAKELNLPPNRVSYQIRYDRTVSPQTSLKFMTDGVLLREVSTDLLLSKYSVLLIDEAHERSVNTDVLIGLLSRIVRLRANRWLQGEKGAKPLRLVIMSATLRVADFVENPTLFPTPPPLIRIDARQHPVSVHFNRKTPNDYQEEAVNKAGKIHTRLPPGGILIFMTGEQEIKTVCNQLEASFGRRAIDAHLRRRNRQEEAYLRRNQADDENGADSGVRVTARPAREDVEAEEVTLGKSDNDSTLVDREGEKSATPNEDPEALDTDSEDDNDRDEELEQAAPVRTGPGAFPTSPMHILPLYSLLPSEKQLDVFKPPPDDARLVVVATNVAETSLTIPNIRYVIDCGRAKERKYDGSSGVSSFKVDWISKASAAQRAGRAGRTGPGHCYRLYSSNVYEEYLEDHAEAEIRRMPVEGLVLQMKSMNIDNVINFPFPTPPNRSAIAQAEKILTRLGALETVTDDKTRKAVTRITELGRTMSLFPLSPRFAKLLVQGQQHGCLPFVVALVAAMSVNDLFVRDEAIADDEEDEDADSLADGNPGSVHLRSEAEKGRQERKEKRKKRYEVLSAFDSLGGAGVSDAFRMLAVVGAYAYSNNSATFCRDNFLRAKAMTEVDQLRRQLSALVLSTLEPSKTTTEVTALLSSSKLAPPTETQFKIIRQLIACAYIDQVAVRADIVPAAARSIPSLAEQATQGRLKTQWKSCRHVPYLAMGVSGEAAYIHRSSSLFEHAPPEWCVFGETMRSRPKDRKSKDDDTQEESALDVPEIRGRVFLKGITKINPAWIPKLGKELCSFSNPVPLSGSGQLSSLSSNIAALKGGARAASSSQQVQQVVITPTYGTGPACEASERASMIGWELPPVKATRQWQGAAKGWKVDL